MPSARVWQKGRPNEGGPVPGIYARKTAME